VVQIFFVFHHNSIRERSQLRSKSRIKLAVAQYSVRLGHGDRRLGKAGKLGRIRDSEPLLLIYFSFIYTLFGLGASHMGFAAWAQGKSLPGLAHRLEPTAHVWGSLAHPRTTLGSPTAQAAHPPHSRTPSLSLRCQ
jgi:hypothetical protein